MTRAICLGCGQFVLEIEGQFELLNPLLLRGEWPPSHTAGEWHSTCLAASEYGEPWFQARHQSYVQMQRYAELTRDDEWVVLESAINGDRLALSRAGGSVDLDRALVSGRAVPGGRVYTLVEREFNLVLADTALIGTMQHRLESAGRFPILELADGLGIGGRLSREVLQDSFFGYDPSLREDFEWSPTFVSARVEYGVFLPAVLEAFVRPA